VTDPQALGQALHAADAWRRERLGFLQQATIKAAALKTVNEIGMALSAERDPDRLLALILVRACQLVAADAGSLYLVEENPQGERHLRFAMAQNDSITAPWQAFTLPLTPHSVAGAVALSGQGITIADVYALPLESPLQYDRTFDIRFGYRTRSIVALPLITRDDHVCGVLQLINRKPVAAVPLADPQRAEEVVPFSDADVELLRSLASQAAVSLENGRLYKDIQRLFEGFVQASVKAIEQRDPTTLGHSFRVADGTLALAKRVEHLERGRWAGVRFSIEELRELRYAALLHDFGKVMVPERVLTKAGKLHDDEMGSLHYRFLWARAAHRASRVQEWLHEALRDPVGMQRRLPQLEAAWQHELAALSTWLQTVLEASHLDVLDDDGRSPLDAIRRYVFVDLDGQQHHLLTEQEIEVLSLRRGNLNRDERDEIEKHVTHSYQFLRTIPWTRDLARVPELAGGHHEKLDGSGYPFGLAGEDIPLGVRMMTIADIFDALVANDRPYKKALPLERALSVLEDEAQQGKLDTTLVQVWIDAKAWEDIGTHEREKMEDRR
jgi:HD-GYP domain-containing protein (c-di-GMP phosphodiesterase class II)